MSGAEAGPVMHVPARELPVPTSISAQAQAVLGMARPAATPWPAVDDAEGWKRRIAAQDEGLLAMMGARAEGAAVDVDEREVDGVRVFVITPHGTAADDRRAYLDIHGGALILGGGAVCRTMGIATAVRSGVTTWAVDYRMPPDHPYPAPLDDCVAAYRALVTDRGPEHVIVGGGSAGGNLAAALILRARDEGLPLPAAAVLSTPELDLTESGDSFRTNAGVDSVLGSLMDVNLLYAAGHDLTDPYVSPLFGDVAAGFPPTLLSTGTRDLFLSNTVRMHRKLRAAGIEAELHVLEAAPHGGFMGAAPEDAALDAEVRRFLEAHWS